MKTFIYIKYRGIKWDFDGDNKKTKKLRRLIF